MLFLKKSLVLLTAIAIIFFNSCSAQKKISRSTISKILNNSANWQIDNFNYVKTGSSAYLHDHGIDSWTNAVFYLGLLEWAKTSNNKEYSQWLYEVGEKNQWNLANNFSGSSSYGIYHADELCMGQFYLNMYENYKKDSIYSSTQSRLNTIIENPPLNSMNPNNKQKWTWCDALFMAPAVYAQMTDISNDQQYTNFMHKEFMSTFNYLYSKEDSLFYRDATYFNKKELNGERVFWGRGNGWVVSGIVQILKYLPEDSKYRPFYEDLFHQMMHKLLRLQGKDGFWHASLLNPENYPAPETSATAFILYAMTYGVNHNLLEKNTFAPAIKLSWSALSGIVAKNGKLGYVQPIGADPRKVTKDMTAVYGVGAFLMAGSEIYKIIDEL